MGGGGCWILWRRVLRGRKSGGAGSVGCIYYRAFCFEIGSGLAVMIV